MTVTIYDAVDVPALPVASYYLAYIDGGYVTYDKVRARFPGATIKTVTTTGLNKADICDVESGDATPTIAAEGVAAGRYGTVYSDVSTKHYLDGAMAGQNWNWYAANPSGVAHIVPGAVATQWAWPGYGSPGNYDISWALESWVNPPPPPPPTGGPVAVTPVFEFKANQLDVIQVTGGQLLHKWATGTGWQTETIGFAGVTYTGQPEVAVIGGACWVSVEDSTGKAWTFLQTQNANTWQNSKLP